MLKVLVTGAAGFIGFHLAEKLLAKGHTVVGIDSINDYYDTSLKYARLNQSGIAAENAGWNTEIKSTVHPDYSFFRIKLEDKDALFSLCDTHKFDIIVNLAAQAGVRYSLENPHAYAEANVIGFLNILEAARHFSVRKVVYASSSSVYGAGGVMPFSVNQSVDKPVSLYAATKKSNELMAYTYSHLFGIKMIGLRFFTVYGPWGRPDMAMFLFTDAILKGKPIKVFNNGNLSRDFTYVDDIVGGVISAIETEKPELPLYEVYNIGNSKPVQLERFIDTIEKYAGKKAIKEYMPMQPGDMEATWADVEDFKQNYNYNPATDLEQGVAKYVEWFQSYYKI
ncbi:NAD-dependent epimerase/dehydratase family protein [Flavobacterium sp. RHBU_3]|uniref:NAD-dependent epimerase/dehydratase family protein n=1 Tax=Flavobacterium sp. RHBU_3 TaxID=3391184 RepID=UPI003984E806